MPDETFERSDDTLAGSLRSGGPDDTFEGFLRSEGLDDIFGSQFLVRSFWL